MKFYINMVNNNYLKFGNFWIRVNIKLLLIFFGGVGRGGGEFRVLIKFCFIIEIYVINRVIMKN